MLLLSSVLIEGCACLLMPVAFVYNLKKRIEPKSRDLLAGKRLYNQASMIFGVRAGRGVRCEGAAEVAHGGAGL
jgi:hypothetical protein